MIPVAVWGAYNARMNRAVRLPIFILAAVLILLAADTAAWWILTSRLLTEVAAWQQGHTEEGYRVTAGPAARTGWPFRATLRLPDVGVATGTPGSATLAAWHSDEVRLVYAPWRPKQVVVALDGAQTLQFGTAPAFTVPIEAMDLVVPLDQSGQAAGLAASARRIRLPLRTGEAHVDGIAVVLGAADIRLSVSGLTLPSPGLPLGVTIGTLDLHARSTTPLPPQRDLAAAAAAWRDAGGQCAVDDFALSWGSLEVHGTGLFGLDGALQPIGNATVRTTGFGQAIDALVHAGIMPRNSATVATTLLGLMARPNAQGVPEAALPFTLANGLLSTGAIPLVKLPTLVLP